MPEDLEAEKLFFLLLFELVLGLLEKLRLEVRETKGAEALLPLKTEPLVYCRGRSSLLIGLNEVQYNLRFIMKVTFTQSTDY